MKRYCAARSDQLAGALNGLEKCSEFGMCNGIEHIQPLAPIPNQTCFSQTRKLLGKVGLAIAKPVFKVAYTALAISPQDIEESKAGRMSQRLEQIRTEPIKVHDINLSSIFNIQNIEYPPSIILVVTIVMKIKTGVQIYWIPIQCS